MNYNENEINAQFNRQFGFTKASLPNAVPSMVLGIVSTFFGLIWCYWIGSIISLTCGIIAIILAKRSKELYDSNPEAFKPNALSNVNAGRVLGIIGVCLSSLALLFLIVVIIIAVAAGSNDLFD